MNALDFLRLFRAILSDRAPLDATAIERMGLLAVKIAQMYSVRADLVSPQKCAQLARLLQQTTPLSGREFQARYSEIVPLQFTEQCKFFDPVPMASASLGQAHRATLRSGEQVVVKILRADCEEHFRRDAAKLRSWLKGALFFSPKLERLADPMAALDAVERQTLREIDFTSEIRGAQRLAQIAREGCGHLPHMTRVRFPKYFEALSNPRFLVSEFIKGPTLAELIESGTLGYDALLQLFRIHGYFLFVRGEFHGDLHPGNVIYCDGNFWFLDNAVIEHIDPSVSRMLFEMLTRIGAGKLDDASELLSSLSQNRLSPTALKKFQSCFAFLYRDFADKTVSEASLTVQMMGTIKLGVEHGISFPSGAFPFIKSLMYLDGMVLRAAPQARLLEDVQRFAHDFGQHLTPGKRSPTLDAALRR